MSEQAFTYVVVGSGKAGVSAVEGIRELDAEGTILLIGDEKHLPYERPPLSKQLWFGKAKVNDIFTHDQSFYNQHGITVNLGVKVVEIDRRERKVSAANGDVYRFEKLLLATGVEPRKLPIPGGDIEEICYFRTLEDYFQIQHRAAKAKSALIIGGGFIGSELAAALSISLDEVTLIFPSTYICSRVFPEPLGQKLQGQYRARGIRILNSEMPVSISKNGSGFRVDTSAGKSVYTDIVIVGIGATPSIDLAQAAGLDTGDGIVVNEYLETSHPGIYAAGDNAFFPCPALGRQMRNEHWDNALSQGKQAGRNMAGAQEPYTYLPYFFSDIFEFGYEAVGHVSTGLEMFADWKKENETGVIYYLADNKVRGVMMCNVWDKLEAARELIRKGERVKTEQLRGMIL
ncbi:MAG: FAD-dependent oxidoreductase [Gallionellaceae bacterium]|nr:FAD-dependent oxidoreductase [Gallionellaceae bacterium]